MMKKHWMKRLVPLVLVWSMLISVLLPAFVVNAYAEDQETDLRRVSGTPLITFRDESGTPIEGLTKISADDRSLSFDLFHVSYGETIENADYWTVDLTFSYVDYNYKLFSSGKVQNINLPESSSAVAELMMENGVAEATSIECSPSSKGYLRLDITFEQINLFNDKDNTANLYIRYQRKTNNGDFTLEYSKGEARYTFSNFKLPVEASEEQNTNIEIILPSTNPSGETDSGKSSSIKTITPYIMIEDCSIGEDWAAATAGSSFQVALNCRNTHKKMDLDNVLMQVDVPADLKLNSPSNSFYIGDVKKAGQFQQVLSFSATPGAAAKNYSVPITFSYEYVDGESRREDKITQEIVIPMVQPLRFTVDPIMTLPEYETGREYELICSCANLSRAKIYNVQASIEADEGLYYMEKVQHLGNLGDGAAGQAKFHLFAKEEGVFSGTVCYRYENEWSQETEEKVDFQMTFVPPAEEEVEETVSTHDYITEIPTVTQDSKPNNDLFLTIAFIVGVVVIMLAWLIKQSYAGRK